MSARGARGACALQILAARVGLTRSYLDAWGRRQHISDERLRVLLASLGLAAGSDAEVERALRCFDDQAWDRVLDAVIVTQEGLSLESVVRLREGSTIRTLEWRITTEQGGSIAGALPLSAMPFSERRGDRVRRQLSLPQALPLGYHAIDISCGGEVGSARLIVVPARAYSPELWSAEPPRRDWAITAQLYSLVSASNWGIGDFSDLVRLGREAGERGACAIGVNPLHALFPANPMHVSPYSPSSRTFLNPIYLDVTAVPEFALDDEARNLMSSAEWQRSLRQARDAESVAYPRAWALKRAVLQSLHRRFRRQHLGADGDEPISDAGAAFRRFQKHLGQRLERFAVFEALQEHFVQSGLGPAWRNWPSAYRDPASEAVAAFAREHAELVQFSQYLQWQADRQLGRAAQGMREAGMATGLYRDVAVGVDPSGAEAWSDQSLLVSSASVGAPPDLYNLKGQDWGLAPFSPLALKARAYEPFIATVRANMRHAGALRIDHVIGLQRLWWVPSGGSGPEAGAYVQYPLDDLIGIVALESQRHQCLVVGEDLGTVPEGFREEMQRRRILSYRLLMFEREQGEGDFLPPTAYPAFAAAAVSTHDLPTLRGLWRGRDLEWRRALGLYPSAEAAQKEAAGRDATRAALLVALRAYGGLAQEAGERLGEQRGESGQDMLAVAEAAHRLLASVPSRLLLLQLEDLVGEVEQMNLPGTIDEHPNWRRKLSVPIERIFAGELAQRIVRAVREARQRALPGA